MSQPLVIWQMTDGKPGHENQTRGLIAALGNRLSLHSYRIPVNEIRCGWRNLLTRTHPCRDQYPPPDLILACGRATHFPALAARRACGGRLVSLMKPPYPTSLYDFCLIPVHDGVAPASNIELTRGVLNPIARNSSGSENTNRGLILIGGPSAHHSWNGPTLIHTLQRLLACNDQIHWTLTTSRRTPAGFVEELQSAVAASADRIQIVPVEQTPQGWVGEQLALCSTAVVTDDSVSMVYESLTAGVSVLLIPMPRKGSSRVTDGVDCLMADSLVHPVEALLSTGQVPAGSAALAEADRCADLLVINWFSNQSIRVA